MTCYGNIACSANGTIVLLVSEGAIEISPDTGSTWYQVNALTSDATVTVSADGNTLAAFWNGTIYLSLPPPTQPSQISITPSNGVPNVSLSGQPGYAYIVQASTNLLYWTNIATLVNSSGTVPFTDPGSTNYAFRFYRAIAA